MTNAWTTGSIAELVGGVCEGSPDERITGVASLESARAGELAFCNGGRWLKKLPSTGATAVLLGRGQVPEGCVAIRVNRPRYAYAQAAAVLIPQPWPSPGVHPTACVHPSAVTEGATVGPFAVIDEGVVLGPQTWVMAHAYVGHHVTTGSRCRIMPHAVVMERSVLGEGVWIHPGAVIGADGFGHVRGPQGVLRVPQLGTVRLEDDVEVGANACVDRAALNETRIGKQSRLDNLVQVAHGVQIGAQCLVAAFAGIAGGAKLGDRVVMGGRTAVVDGIEVGDDAVFAALASASRDVPPGRRIGGSPARGYTRWLREVAALRRLPALLRRVDALEQRVGETDESDGD